MLESDRTGRLHVLQQSTEVESVEVVREFEVDVQLLTTLERGVDRLDHLPISSLVILPEARNPSVPGGRSVTFRSTLESTARPGAYGGWIPGDRLVNRARSRSWHLRQRGGVLHRPKTDFARITSPIPVSSNAMPTTMLKIESISDMNPMSSAVASAVSVTQMLRALFEIGSPFRPSRLPPGRSSPLHRSGFRPTDTAHLRVGQPLGVRQRVLAHDLGLCERLSPVSTGSQPNGGLLCDCRVLDRPDADSLALDVVAGEANPQTPRAITATPKRISSPPET